MVSYLYWTEGHETEHRFASQSRIKSNNCSNPFLLEVALSPLVDSGDSSIIYDHNPAVFCVCVFLPPLYKSV